MISTISYGLLVFKLDNSQIKVLLAHPSGPFWASKDLWTIPKGEPEGIDVDSIATARREFSEETGILAPDKKLLDLGKLRQSPRKVNHIWAVNSDPDISKFSSNMFELEWPRHSGKMQSFYENDRIDWFDVILAKRKLFPKQRQFIDRLNQQIS